MCSHADHEVVKRADGSVAETHVFTDEELRQVAHWRSEIKRIEAAEAD
ncbi:hypothetical protein OG554_03780 [Streptomyces griseus]|nr:hypothetical protein OG554_03780 [Streptomyces fimicarius]